MTHRKKMRFYILGKCATLHKINYHIISRSSFKATSHSNNIRMIQAPHYLNFLIKEILFKLLIYLLLLKNCRKAMILCSI